MRIGWAGLLALATLGHPMDVDVHFPDQGSARIRLFHVPSKEPLGAIKVRLKLRPGAGAQGAATLLPPAGPWSQVMPQAGFTGGSVTLWAMAPAIGESRDSTSRLIASMELSLSPTVKMADAADLIDSVIVEEAFGPAGARTTLSKNLTTGLRPAAMAGPAAPVERVRGPNRTLIFTIAKAQRVRANLTDPRGRRIAGIFDKKLGSGMHEITWDGKADGGKDLPGGTYFLRFEAGTFSYVRKLEVAP
jgi:hypothetical protein